MLILTAAVLLTLQAVAQPAPAPTPQQEFQTLLERVKKSDASVDFTRLRQLQTQLDDYKPYGVSVEEHPFKVLKAGNLDRAQALVQQILAESYLDVDAHNVGALLADKRGDKAAAAHHRYVLGGVIDSILASGDGKTAETAWVVIAVSEEYATVGVLGLQVVEQNLVRDAESGHSYDVLEVMDPETKTTQRVYFNIDSVMGALSKKFPG
ncbi:MAG TPA: DUF4919 domain-containing protein [Thermoanaerobaculia bacterium]|nr:DUF4919 domain-containing protein [Thermoanaerobaculia bacterium]